MRIGNRFLLRPALIGGILLSTNVALAAALVWVALAPKAVVIVPSARAGETIWPGAVPEGAIREFALRYVLHFDNFTPGTIEESTRILLQMISPRSWSGAERALEKRRNLVIEGRMSSQVLPLDAKVVGRVVTVETVRRTFLGDRLSREVTVRYIVTVESQPPTGPNPFGLAVVSQEIEEVSP